MNETNTEKKCKLCGKFHPPRDITLMGLIDSVLRGGGKGVIDIPVKIVKEMRALPEGRK